MMWTISSYWSFGEVYDKYEDALKAFAAKFKQNYKAQVNKTYKNKVNQTYKNKVKLDLKFIFEESKSQDSVMANGRRGTWWNHQCSITKIVDWLIRHLF